ncbi:MAG: ferrochelatase [Candidatus Dormibacteraeota bacterium]|nr:ferrochelatase [Candidatus Dormibacteraeota bacterium]
MTNATVTAPSPGSATTKMAVLLMAYGSPRDKADILPYYTHMRGGRTPSPEAMAELEARYQAIGGHSPLTEITFAQAQRLQEVLGASGGIGAQVAVGMKHNHPFLEEAVAELARQGVTSVVAMVLAPHYSVMSVAGYVERVKAAAEPFADQLSLRFVEDWHLHPGYVAWLARQVGARLDALGSERASQALVIFTAHSLPARLRDMGDPYPDQLGETAAAVAAALDLPNWTTGWQSVAQSAGEPWLGPELLDVVRGETAKGRRDFVVCACGFVADHLEVLFDLDVEAQQEAERLGVTIVRTAMPNDDESFVREVLAELVTSNMRLER